MGGAGFLQPARPRINTSRRGWAVCASSSQMNRSWTFVGPLLRPVRIAVRSRSGDLPQARAVAVDREDLFLAGAAGHEKWRPFGEKAGLSLLPTLSVSARVLRGEVEDLDDVAAAERWKRRSR